MFIFNKKIYTTALTSEVADRLFSNISASNTPDFSFLTTMRILLHNRLPSNETARLTCKSLHIREIDLRGASTSQHIDWLVRGAHQVPAIATHSIQIIHTIHANAGEKMMEFLRANDESVRRHLGGYIRRDDLQVFFARKANALFYTNTEGTHTVIYTDKLEAKRFHVLQMMIPKYFTKLFDNSILTEMEITLLKSMGNKSAVEYEAWVEAYAKTLDIRSEIIRSKLAGFEQTFERLRIDEVRVEINRYQEDYESHLSIMRNISDKIQERQYILAGLESTFGEINKDSDLMEYFMCNKNLSLVKVSGTSIEFVVHGYADVYDVEAFERFVANHNGYMYNNINPSISKVQLEKLYRSIFGELRYKLRMCAAFRADMKNGVVALKYYVFPPESETYFPNPHIQNYGCIGTYAGRFQEYLQRKDYVGAIDQIVVSAKNLNFFDSTVIGGFARDFSKKAIKCIEKSDNTLLTPMEAIAELESEQGS